MASEVKQGMINTMVDLLVESGIAEKAGVDRDALEHGLTFGLSQGFKESTYIAFDALSVTIGLGALSGEVMIIGDRPFPRTINVTDEEKLDLIKVAQRKLDARTVEVVPTGERFQENFDLEDEKNPMVLLVDEDGMAKALEDKLSLNLTASLMASREIFGKAILIKRELLK